MGRITPDTLDRIKERLPVSAVVSRRVPLKRAGRELRGLSPFQHERTPSFYVNDSKGFFHCFSSGKHGNIFDFVMEMEGLSFVEAVEELAQEAGVEVQREGLTRETQLASRARKWVGSALQCAQAFFSEQLETHEPARAYLRERGIRQRVAQDLGIGWAPEAGRLLVEHLADNGFTIADIIEAGLAIQPDDPNRAPYAFFRNRITFPIFGRKHDAADVLSFGARTISGEDPKYLNGRETAFFDKGRTLYNLSRARSAIMEAGVAIVLEGYIDVAMVSQTGVQNVVAPLGTALTVEHLHALWRIAPLVVYFADGDRAGVKAGFRTLETALPWISGHRRLTFATPPAGMDPDDLVRQAGIEAFRDVVRGADSTVERLWQWLRADVPGDAPEDRAKVEAAIAERLAPVSDASMRKAFTDELLGRARWIGRAKPQLGQPNLARRIASAIPAREAALIVAAVLHPEYVEADFEAFAAVEVHAPVCAKLKAVVVESLSAGTSVPFEDVARDVAVLQSALPHPVPSFVATVNPDAFRAALHMQSRQAARKLLRASYQGA